MDERERTFSYAVVPEDAPFFFKGVENTFNLKPLGNDRTEVSMNANVKLSPVIGTLLGPLVKRRMLKGFVGILEELKEYVQRQAKFTLVNKRKLRHGMSR